MNRRSLHHPASQKTLLVALIVLLVSVFPGIAFSAEKIDPEADRVLHAMSDYLGKTNAFSMNADIGNEIITNDGQKLQLSSASQVVMERPRKFHVSRKGMFADLELFYDGTLLTLYGKKINAYAQFEVVGTTDDAIRVVEFETGLAAPGADLLFSVPYAILSSGVVSSAYLGTDYVNGIECHHLAFREDKVDWQIWVQTGDTPLPLKYIITSKWLTGAPQYSVQLRDWNTSPTLNADQFRFLPPKGAQNLANIEVDALGNLMTNQEDQ